MAAVASSPSPAAALPAALSLSAEFEHGCLLAFRKLLALADALTDKNPVEARRACAAAVRIAADYFRRHTTPPPPRAPRPTDRPTDLGPAASVPQPTLPKGSTAEVPARPSVPFRATDRDAGPAASVPTSLSPTPYSTLVSPTSSPAPLHRGPAALIAAAGAPHPAPPAPP